ncbi:hypothetical protein [Bacillus sp. JCM 19041]|uniref:hypothetical protein n=1 Tax=Bacillus sp. JCM 19041 TaxID=1460637 RepID=UPI0006CF5233
MLDDEQLEEYNRKVLDYEKDSNRKVELYLSNEEIQIIENCLNELKSDESLMEEAEGEEQQNEEEKG